METSRKRKLSTEASYLPQLKCYVDENVQNKQSEKKMHEIYSRTVNLLFKAAQQKQAAAAACFDSNAQYREIKAQEGSFHNGGKMPEWFTEAPVQVCETCRSNSKLSVECNNCNMNGCERCAFACTRCKDPLCHNCVNLFNCGTAEQPICDRCSSY